MRLIGISRNRSKCCAACFGSMMTRFESLHTDQIYRKREMFYAALSPCTGIWFHSISLCQDSARLQFLSERPEVCLKWSGFGERKYGETNAIRREWRFSTSMPGTCAKRLNENQKAERFSVDGLTIAALKRSAESYRKLSGVVLPVPPVGYIQSDSVSVFIQMCVQPVNAAIKIKIISPVLKLVSVVAVEIGVSPAIIVWPLKSLEIIIYCAGCACLCLFQIERIQGGRNKGRADADFFQKIASRL